jgi:hypothetical protein
MQGNRALFIFSLLLFGMIGKATAQNPWQQSKGEILLSPYFSNYRATAFRNRSGEKIDFAQDGQFTNYNPRMYFSLPIKDYKVNLFGSLPYFFNQYKDNSKDQRNTDFGDIELGLRFHVKQLKNHYLMASVTTFIPAYTNNRLPYAGFGRFGVEGRVHLTGNSPWMGESNNFHKVEVGYRYFFPSDPGQIRVFASQGIRVTKKVVLLGELEGLFSFSDDSEFFENNLQLVSDFTMVKASINLGYEFTPKFSMYGGVFQDILNRNSGIGSGFQVFSVIRIASK